MHGACIRAIKAYVGYAEVYMMDEMENEMETGFVYGFLVGNM